MAYIEAHPRYDYILIIRDGTDGTGAGNSQIIQGPDDLLSVEEMLGVDNIFDCDGESYDLLDDYLGSGE